ncbi:tail fiber domain-containing protein [Aquimarina sp. 2-A2]
MKGDAVQLKEKATPPTIKPSGTIYMDTIGNLQVSDGVKWDKKTTSMVRISKLDFKALTVVDPETQYWIYDSVPANSSGGGVIVSTDVGNLITAGTDGGALITSINDADSDPNNEIQNALGVPYTATGNTISTNVQDAITEIQTELDGFSAGSGQTNTASNVGTGGVGLFKQKTGVNLEFKNIKAASNKLSVTNVIGTNTVDLDVNQANLTITESQISNLSHTVNTDNQTAAQVPFTPTGNTVANNTQLAIQELQTEIDGISGGSSLVVDNEDIKNVANTISFKDRDASLNQEGYKIIRQGFNFSAIPAGHANSIWEIRYVHDLANASITIPAGVTLFFNGGKLENAGIVTFNDTYIRAKETDFIIDPSNTVGKLSNTLVYPQWFGAIGDGVNNDSVEFELALRCTSNALAVLNTSKYYIIGNVNVPIGVDIIGFGKKHIEGISTLGELDGATTIQVAPTANYIFDFKGSNHVSNLNLYGRQDVELDVFGVPNATSDLILENISMFNFNYAFGGGQISNSRIVNCYAEDNGWAFTRILNSEVIDSKAFDNDFGVYQSNTPASGNTTFLNMKAIANYNYNFYIGSSNGNKIIGGISEDCDFEGVYVINSKLTIDGLHSVRNGISGTSQRNAHFVVEGDQTELIMNNNTTEAKLQDGGGGTLLPEYSILMLNDNSAPTLIPKSFIASNNDFSGANSDTKWNFLSYPTENFVVNNIGIQESEIYKSLKITSKDNGDATLTIEADESNLLEGNNPNIKLSQDGGAVLSVLRLNSDDNIDFAGSLGNYTSFSNSFATAGYQWAVNGSEKMTLFPTGALSIDGALSQNSDIRLKENITPITNALSKVKGLNGVTYNKIGETKNEIGLIAQNVQDFVPEVITERDDEMKTLTVAYQNLVGLLVEAIKELELRVEVLENK